MDAHRERAPLIYAQKLANHNRVNAINGCSPREGALNLCTDLNQEIYIKYIHRERAQIIYAKT